jgi:hypothetical protein
MKYEMSWYIWLEKHLLHQQYTTNPWFTHVALLIKQILVQSAVPVTSPPVKTTVLWMSEWQTLTLSLTITGSQLKWSQHKREREETEIPWGLPRAMPSLHPFCLLHWWFAQSWSIYLHQMTHRKVGYQMAKTVLTSLWIRSSSPEHCHRTCDSPLSLWKPHSNQPNQHSMPIVGGWCWFSTLWLLKPHQALSHLASFSHAFLSIFGRLTCSNFTQRQLMPAWLAT